MSRVPNTPISASPGQKTMTRTIQCPECGVVLNVPDSAAGRRLKCPQCATKFSAPAFDPGASAIGGAGPASSLLPTRGPGSSGSVELPTRGLDSSGSVELPKLPAASGLGETYELPFLTDPVPAPAPKGARPGPHVAPPPAAAADVLALFLDEPKSARKPKGAEARAQARRCPTCGNVVPVGMSLCSTCGLDLDTGKRIAPLEILEDEMPEPYREPVPPMGVLFVGSITAMGFLILSVASLVWWQKGMGGVQFLLIIWLFGLYGAVQFLRRRSIRPLFLALSLAVGIGAVALIVMPIVAANMPPEVVDNLVPPAPGEDPDLLDIKPLTDKLDLNRITWGIASMLAYAAVAVYLNSPGLRKQFRK